MLIKKSKMIIGSLSLAVMTISVVNADEVADANARAKAAAETAVKAFQEQTEKVNGLNADAEANRSTRNEILSGISSENQALTGQLSDETRKLVRAVPGEKGVDSLRRLGQHGLKVKKLTQESNSRIRELDEKLDAALETGVAIDQQLQQALIEAIVREYEAPLAINGLMTRIVDITAVVLSKDVESSYSFYNDDARAQIEDLKAAMVAKIDELRVAQSKSGVYGSKASAATAQLGRAGKSTAALTDATSKAVASGYALHTSNVALKTEVASLEGQVGNLTAQLATATNTIAKVSADLAQAQAVIVQKDAAMSATNNVVAELTAQLAAAQAQASSANSQIAATREANSGFIRSLFFKDPADNKDKSDK